mmetsp:Transcript_7383/g.11348  ORF Transcript_7383/g.11348 Transcript_7383/m.11348 type:complete len:210 (-) Transcript_7383:190-819(-)
MMAPADTTPVKMDEMAKAVGMPRMKDAMAPVHAPVPGRGIPTKAARDTHCFLRDPTPKLLDFFSARSRTGAINAFSLSLRNKNKRGTMGTMLPKTLASKTVVIGSPIHTPTGMAPRNSTTGMAAIMANTATSGNPKERKKFAIFCPVCKCSVVPDACAALETNMTPSVKTALVSNFPLETTESDHLFLLSGTLERSMLLADAMDKGCWE